MQMLSFGIVEGNAVFMDARTDAYFTLDAPDQDRLFALIERGSALASDTQLRSALGIDNEQAEIVQAQPLQPACSIIDQAITPPAKIIDILRVAAVVRIARGRLLRQPIEEVLAAASVHRLRGTHYSSKEVMQRALQFAAARKLVPLKANCLLDSLALISWLRNPPADLAVIFGAKLHPFAAHCWVQLGELVLNDRLENVSSFTAVRVMSCSAATP